MSIKKQRNLKIRCTCNNVDWQKVTKTFL